MCLVGVVSVLFWYLSCCLPLWQCSVDVCVLSAMLGCYEVVLMCQMSCGHVTSVVLSCDRCDARKIMWFCCVAGSVL